MIDFNKSRSCTRTLARTHTRTHTRLLSIHHPPSRFLIRSPECLPLGPCGVICRLQLSVGDVTGCIHLHVPARAHARALSCMHAATVHQLTTGPAAALPGISPCVCMRLRARVSPTSLQAAKRVALQAFDSHSARQREGGRDEGRHKGEGAEKAGKFRFSFRQRL